MIFPITVPAIVATQPAFHVFAQQEVVVVNDIAYYEGADADAKKHKLDIYTPKGLKDFPVVFFIHGGTWSSGDRKMYGNMGQMFASQGIGVVVISYRLSPAVTHPVHIEDVARAFAWTHANIAKYGGRADRIFVAGHSAGGHLTSLLAANPEYLKKHNLSSKNIRGIIPISGVYDIPAGMFPKIFPGTADALKPASPVKNLTAGGPPALVIYADQDYAGLDLLAKQYTAKLGELKTQATLELIKDRTHITIITKMMLSAKDATSTLALDFIRKYAK
jgi:acetyl esterase/lipase